MVQSSYSPSFDVTNQQLNVGNEWRAGSTPSARAVGLRWLPPSPVACDVQPRLIVHLARCQKSSLGNSDRERKQNRPTWVYRPLFVFLQFKYILNEQPRMRKREWIMSGQGAHSSIATTERGGGRERLAAGPRPATSLGNSQATVSALTGGSTGSSSTCSSPADTWFLSQQISVAHNLLK